MALPEPVTPDSLRAWRAAVPCSRPRLAEALGVSPSSIKRWESGAGVVPLWLRWALAGLGPDLRKRVRRSIRDRAARARKRRLRSRRVAERKRRRRARQAQEQHARAIARVAQRERARTRDALKREHSALIAELCERGGHPHHRGNRAPPRTRGRAAKHEPGGDVGNVGGNVKRTTPEPTIEGSEPLDPRSEIAAVEMLCQQRAAGPKGLSHKEAQRAQMVAHCIAEAWVGPGPDEPLRQRRSRHVRAAAAAIEERIAYLERETENFAQCEAGIPPGLAVRNLVRIAELRWCLHVVRNGVVPPAVSWGEPEGGPDLDRAA